jgi:hypothetical protein
VGAGVPDVLRRLRRGARRLLRGHHGVWPGPGRRRAARRGRRLGMRPRRCARRAVRRAAGPCRGRRIPRRRRGQPGKPLLGLSLTARSRLSALICGSCRGKRRTTRGRCSGRTPLWWARRRTTSSRSSATSRFAWTRTESRFWEL